MAKKWPRPAEVLSCVVIDMWVGLLVIGAWAFIMVFFSLLSSWSDDGDIILLGGGVLLCPALGSSLSYLCLLVFVFICLLVRTYETGTDPALLALPALPGRPPHPMASVDARSGS